MAIFHTFENSQKIANKNVLFSKAKLTVESTCDAFLHHTASEDENCKTEHQTD